MRDYSRPLTLYHPLSTLHFPFSLFHPSHVLAMLLLAAALLASCSKLENQWQVGGLYSIKNGEGHFAIAKVLAIDPGVVSVRIYKQLFPSRPKQIDPSTLSLGSLKEGPDFGIGHLPLTPEAFKQRAPVFIMKVDVRDDELEGYRTWKKSVAGPTPEPASPGGPPNG